MKTKLLSICILYTISSSSFSQPCEGTPLLSEQFENGIPVSWTVINLDANTVYWSLVARGYTGSFQSFTRNGHKCVANVAYFSVTPNSANDWLISPAVTISSAPACLSWQASSMYAWANSYEVRISTTTPTVSAFMSNPVLFTQASEQVAWSNYSVDLSAYAGQTVYIGFFYNGTDQYPIYFDDIRITNPVTRDVSVKTLEIYDVVNVASHPVTGQLLNGGTSTITSMDLHWNVNNGPTNTANLSSLNIAPTNYYNYLHSINWNPSSNGTYTLKVWASNINGLPDMYLPNDTLTQLQFVHNNPRVVLVEEFTNTDCPPCATQNPVFDALLGYNRDLGKVSMIKYHAPWPGPTDPMYMYNTTDIADRLFYYGSPGLPNATINGFLIPNDCATWFGAPACLDQTDIDSAYAIPSIFQIQVSNSISGTLMSVSVTVTALTNVPLNSLRLRTVVVEDTLIYGSPPGTNGETDFYQPMRKMLPDANGTLLPTMTTNQTLTYNYSWTVASPAVLSQLRTVAFIQDDNTIKIHQSKMTNSITVGMNELSENSANIKISPNPSNGNFIITSDEEISSVEIYNVLGELISPLSLRRGVGGEVKIDLSAQVNEIYFVKVQSGEKIYSQKIIVQ